ncbi:hypothetical protein MKX03_033543 [Papaver bracteatum]|nr:hypothetical protein MKX03_033543 [Papaver bracteatum]
MDSSPTTSGFVNIKFYFISKVKKLKSDLYTYKLSYQLHIFFGKVNGVIGGDSYNVKDDGASRIKVQKIQSLTTNIGVVYRFVSSLVFDAYFSSLFFLIVV